MSNSVLVVGSVAFDDVETPFGKRVDAIGGSAVYFSVAASHFSNVRLVGVAGQDFPEEIVALLKKHSINLEGLEIAEGKTFRWGGKYYTDVNKRDTLYTDLNVFASFEPKIPKTFLQTPFVFLGNIQPALQSDVLNKIQKPKFVALDTMNLWINTTRDELMKVIRRVDLLFINDTELAELTGHNNPYSGLRKLHELGLNYIVLKKGEHGAMISNGKSLFISPAFPVLQPTDPTGAGDSFAGGFMGFLTANGGVNWRVLKKALVYGSVMGSLCVEQFSIDGLLNIQRKAIQARFDDLRKLVTL
ncbi:MAG: PfkB family carbohydrate kinase [Candidatus Marinimicrobia bacterium]|nr:PfkB family carbohydrate kinase [Candidatus Neomarinimicrobiota bacterium]